MRNLPCSKTRSGFTLIELLTVIAIIGILAAIIIPTVGKVRETAKAAACLSNIRQLGFSLIMYAEQNKGQLPGENNPFWDKAALSMFMPEVNGEVPYNKILRCPSDNEMRTGANVDKARSYGYNSVMCNAGGKYGGSQYGVNLPAKNEGMRLSGIVNPSRVGLLLEYHSSLNIYNKGDYSTRMGLLSIHNGGMNVAFADGRAQRIKATEELLATGENGLTNFVNRYLKNSP
jgi:prepilin-type N-terminal cleavage/methylation domain-containing protein/prepilin-type processing-associated H-X9-DG protein